MPIARSLKSAALAYLFLVSACESPPLAEGRAVAAPSREAAAIAAAAHPITGTEGDYADLLPAIGGAHRILLGESTHGTHEYYRERSRISERLIREKGVNAILIEGDWSPTYRVNLYVRGLGSDRSAEAALRGYTRFPGWMWGNTDFRDLVERLRAYNLTRPKAEQVGVYGMDVYDLFDASASVLSYLRDVDPAAAGRAKTAYACFAPYRGDTGAYGAATRRPGRSCEKEAASVLAEMRRLPKPAEPVAAEAHFAAVRSAASVAAAEAYFRTVYTGSLAWNVRDQAMARNVEEIAEHVGSLAGRRGKVVIWSHNTHSGDARATFAARQGELNLGQLMRQRHGDAAFLIGFFSYSGTVMAAPEWDAPGRVYTMRPALPESYSALFHQSGLPAFSLLLRARPEIGRVLSGPMLERAIGVVYVPEAERQSHYFDANLAEQFDGLVFFDRSRAVTASR